jgi:predicted nucleotidyltransferase
MLKHNEANPLNVHQMRRVEHLPPHFTKVMFTLGTQEKIIVDWIWENLEGRFYLGDWYSEKATGTLDVQKVAAFETAGEASLFALILDTVNVYA